MKHYQIKQSGKTKYICKVQEFTLNIIESIMSRKKILSFLKLIPLHIYILRLLILTCGSIWRGRTLWQLSVYFDPDENIQTSSCSFLLLLKKIKKSTKKLCLLVISAGQDRLLIGEKISIGVVHHTSCLVWSLPEIQY